MSAKHNHSDSETPFFEQKAPRLSWRELGIIVGVVGMCATTWAATSARLNEIERRQTKLEAAFEDIPSMKTDIQWIRRELENKRHATN